MISADKVRQLYERLEAFVRRGTRTLSVEEGFKIALKIEISELDVIYGFGHVKGPFTRRVC